VGPHPKKTKIGGPGRVGSILRIDRNSAGDGGAWDKATQEVLNIVRNVAAFARDIAKWVGQPEAQELRPIEDGGG
jgi:hypothetical protein